MDSKAETHKTRVPSLLGLVFILQLHMIDLIHLYISSGSIGNHLVHHKKVRSITAKTLYVKLDLNRYIVELTCFFHRPRDYLVFSLPRIMISQPSEDILVTIDGIKMINLTVLGVTIFTPFLPKMIGQVQSDH